ncbi:MAG: phospholipase D family protein [Pseudomonadota bacterium]
MGILKALVGSRVPEKYHKYLDLPQRRASFRYADTRNSRLGAFSAAWQQTHGDASGVYRLLSGREALGARLALIDAAEVSIDIQSYLIRYDISGNLIALRLIDAARRGVRVRLLMDDALTFGSDAGLTALDGESGIEVRVFNPFPRQRSRTLSFLLNFNILNRRMHNKSFTVDNAVTIVGGRNIADEYYQTREDAEFLDEDLLAIGRVVDDVSLSFDDYWNAREACPVSFLKPGVRAATAESVTANARTLLAEPRAVAYTRALEAGLVDDLVLGAVPLHAGKAELICDRPEKVRGMLRNGTSRTSRYLQRLVSGADREVIIVSPYFVPLRQGVDFLSALVRKGVRVVVVTNSLASTNHSSVHAAYARYRRPLLRQGVELYELSSVLAAEANGLAATTKLTLHSKLAVVDREEVFVGSFNLDPRSLFINTEMGLGVTSKTLASETAVAVCEALPSLAYQLSLDRKGRLRWNVNAHPGGSVLTREPETRWPRRLATRLLGFLPIESQM